MIGYKYFTEQEAIDARQQAADYKGYPVPNGETLWWVNYNYSDLDGFYYIRHVEGLEAVLGEPSEFEVTQPDFEI
tara:strand:+ start:2163 stop:2387 length:225 start_codon:yes stop_codon:yes gene_type:complete